MADSEELIKRQDLLEFIKNEKKSPSLSEINKSFPIYIKYLTKSIYYVYLKTRSITDLDMHTVIQMAINMTYHVFWTLFSYTFNIKLTMFMSERAILLFTEFIIMSRNPILNQEMNFVPNISDAVLFSYKKTIGPIKVSNSGKNTKMKILQTSKVASIDIKFLVTHTLFYILEYQQVPSIVTDSEHECWIQNCDYIKTNVDILNTLDKVVDAFGELLLSIYRQPLSSNYLFDTMTGLLTGGNFSQQALYYKLLLELIHDISKKRPNRSFTNYKILVTGLLDDKKEEVKQIVGGDLNEIMNIKRLKNYKLLSKAVWQTLK